MIDRATAAQLARLELKVDLLLRLYAVGRHDARRASFLASVHAYTTGDWCARWLIEAAADSGGTSEALARAIAEVVGEVQEGAARRLGAFVADAVGHADGWSLERVGEHRDGILYRVSRVAVDAPD
jgi:hypothetical protein